METLDEIVKRNLKGSAYLQTWIDLPHYMKCVIAESANEVVKNMKKDNKNTEHNDTGKILHISDVIKRFLGIRIKLTYEERVRWFASNFYETGMEYQIMLDNMKNDDLDNFKWYDDFIKIPKYKDEL